MATASPRALAPGGRPPPLLRDARQVADGLRLSATARELAERVGVPEERVPALLGIPGRTWSRRRAADRLSPEESDRAWRILHAMDLAMALFEGDAEGARRWMTSPKPALDGATPLETVGTAPGAEAVAQLIAGLDQGVFG